MPPAPGPRGSAMSTAARQEMESRGVKATHQTAPATWPSRRLAQAPVPISQEKDLAVEAARQEEGTFGRHGRSVLVAVLRSGGLPALPHVPERTMCRSQRTKSPPSWQRY